MGGRMSEPLTSQILSRLSALEQNKLGKLIIRYQKVLRRALHWRDLYAAKHRKNPSAEILSVLLDKQKEADAIVEASEQELISFRAQLKKKYSVQNI
ncbi:MAG: hypothetical protein EBU66_18825 [Bacteroidetes bacterium]|nr:hypothetical protein [bacterium]NBP66687.1 hypothetical protein [Bacteroidota bacterium]